MKTDVADVYSGRERNAKGLNAAVEVFVIKSIFIVPDPSSGIRHFVPHEPIPSLPGSGSTWLTTARCPGHDGRLHSHRRTNTRKCEIGWATADRKLTV